MRYNNFRRRGLILLIVLSMLTLFSLLAISYVVFSGQSRSANFGIARRDFHGMKGGEVIDEAMKQILRGTAGTISAVGPHDLLGDLYGSSESSRINLPNLLFKVRGRNADDDAELFAGRFLRIPLYDDQVIPFQAVRDGVDVFSRIPDEYDALTGRVLTFLQGPLSGISFRIVRSVGNISSTKPYLRSSVVIDLDEAGPTVAGKTPAELCYGDNGGYQMWINARELNGLGYGIPYNFDGETTTSTSMTPGGNIPFNLQPGLHPVAAFGGQVGAANEYKLTSSNPNASDSDESYDAPDQNDFFLAHAYSTDPPSVLGQDIIPSFHRAALVNYIINRKDLKASSFTQDDFVHMLDDIQGACGRPLGIWVANLEGLSPDKPYRSANPYFDGSNPGNPVLSIDLQGRWSNWLSGPHEQFIAWARLLTAGPWDVDNDGDGVNDSVWVDLDLPLITSAEGKLLKMMTAYYIEDLDNRLDLNAVGNLAQSTDATFFANPNGNQNYTLQTDLPQGFGLGPAESTLRHLFGNDADWQTFLQSRYGGQYNLPGSGVGTTSPPAPTFDDLRSRLDGGAQVFFGAPFNSLQEAGTRSRRRIIRHDQLPGLPSAPRGEFAMGFDPLGNPLMLRGNLVPPRDQGTDDPYESQLMSTPHQDLPFTVAEWERIYRQRDWDRSSYPRRLESFTPIVNRISTVTPRSSHTRHIPLAATSPTQGAQIANFRELLDAILRFRSPSAVPLITTDAYEQLFPLEFKRAQAMDLNRPFGNGIDDDMDGSIDEPEEMLKNGTDDNGNSAVDEIAELDLFNSSGNDLNLTQRQRALYIAGDQVERTSVSELPVLAPNLGNPAYYGYTQGNIDLEYEAFVNSGITGNAATAADRRVATRHHGQQSRQLMARHLYCLAELLLPDPLVLPNVPAPGATGLDRARAIAQWAVNVIDFRDADHTMTRFAFDPNPFVKKGGTTYWLPNRDSSGNAAGYVVWGMEQPELLLTETGATHDLRIKDTAEDDGPKQSAAPAGTDTNYDQYRIPQGSLFLEFICPRTTGTSDSSYVPGAANSLYTNRGIDRVLNLSAVTPSDGTTNYPVWRVAISEPHMSADTPNESFKSTTATDRHAVTYQLYVDRVVDTDGGSDVINEANQNGLHYAIGSAKPTPSIDRLVWFTNQSDNNDESYILDVDEAAVGLSKTVSGVQQSIPLAERKRHVFFNSNATRDAKVLLAGGQYLVVGPRQATYFGSKTNAGSSHNNEPNDHRIVFQGGQAKIYTTTSGANPVTHPLVQNIVQMTAVTTPPWNRSGTGIEATDEAYPWVGLNVSEPHPTDTGYYPEPTHQLNSDATAPDDPNGALAFYKLPRDAYYDYKDATGGHPNVPFDATLGPIHEFYEPEHPIGNSNAGAATPGTKLDWCTAFLQRLADPERPYHVTFNPYITVDWMPIDLTVFSGEDRVMDAGGMNEYVELDNNKKFKFEFRSKNGTMTSAQPQKTFLSYTSEEPDDIPGTKGTNAFFKEELPAEDVASRAASVEPNLTTLGYLNSAFAMLDPAPAAYVGAPSPPPANLQWYNRDFASPYELMLVPLSAPGQLMQEFSVPAVGQAGTNSNYSGPAQPNTFAHLPNFFQQADNSANRALPHSFTAATLLELVTVPSPWSDAEKVIPPANFNLNFATNQREVIMLGPLMPPYNRVSQMREPGRVNINTLEDAEVLRGLEWSYLNTADRNSVTTPASITGLMNNLILSRNKAYPNGLGTEQIAAPNNTRLNGNYPTEFPGVFKSSLAAGRVAPTAGVLDSLAIQSPAQATIFRQGPAGTNRPLFGPRTDLADTSVPNPQSEYLSFSRLANLTTTRSNVFAVRITVGYFEYDTSTGVGPEYGWDNGQTRRHRGFYVIDRSIPVAYEPGQDLNTGNCVLVRRIVE